MSLSGSDQKQANFDTYSKLGQGYSLSFHLDVSRGMGDLEEEKKGRCLITPSTASVIIVLQTEDHIVLSNVLPAFFHGDGPPISGHDFPIFFLQKPV